jgi:NAD(P)-dependent dehydrogenase (short-subunit alcohol dehydrogenase family)
MEVCMSSDDNGRSVLVTGGAKGIGRGIAERFVADGERVVIADVDDAAAEAVVAESGGPGSISAVHCDVTDEASVQAAVDTVVERHGRLDIMVNNAGVLFVSPLAEASLEQWRRIVDINLIGVFLGSRAAARQLIAQGDGGVIINASSGAGRHGAPNLAHYCATKAGITMLSQSLAIELAPQKIRVNCYAPGHIMTPLWDDIAAGFARVEGVTQEDVIKRFETTVPWGRFGTPADVGATVSWLCSDDAEYVSGQTIGMNGAELPWT